MQTATRSLLSLLTLAAAMGGLVWLGWPRIVGIPAWLKQIGLLRWVEGLDPLDRWMALVVNFLVVIVALFQERIRGWLTRAELSIEYQSEPPFCCTVPLNLGNGSQIPAHHMRLGIRNRGRAPAEHIEVHAAALFDSVGRKVPWFLPINLSWADEPQPQGFPPPG